MPEAPQGESIYSQWYKQTYPDTVIGLAGTSNEGLVSVDNAGTVRLWETGVANLQGGDSVRGSPELGKITDLLCKRSDHLK